MVNFFTIQTNLQESCIRNVTCIERMQHQKDTGKQVMPLFIERMMQQLVLLCIFGTIIDRTHRANYISKIVSELLKIHITQAYSKWSHWRTLRVFTGYSLSGENYRAVDTKMIILIESNGEIY